MRLFGDSYSYHRSPLADPAPFHNTARLIDQHATKLRDNKLSPVWFEIDWLNTPCEGTHPAGLCFFIVAFGVFANGSSMRRLLLQQGIDCEKG
jgi:hypothetical protein